MNFNLSQLLTVINRDVDSTKIDMLLTKESKVILRLGDKAFDFDNQKLEEILMDYNFQYYHKPDTIEKINEILSQHIVKQLTISE